MMEAQTMFQHFSRRSFLKGFWDAWFGHHSGREVFHAGLKDRLFLERSTQLYDYIQECELLGLPAYMSVHPFRARNHVFGLEKLFFDFDCREDLGKAWNEARDFAVKIEKFYTAKSLLVFSGCKGFHVYVWLWKTVEVRKKYGLHAKQIYKSLQEKLLKGLERVDYGKIKRTVRQPKSKAKTRQKEVAFDVERQKEILKPPSKARVTAKREKVIAEREEERARMEKDFDRWLEKSKKTKGKARYEIIVGDTVKSGVVTSNLAEAEQQMKKLRRDNPFLRRMRIVKIQKGTYVTVKLEKRKAKPKEGFADSSTNPDLQQKAAAAVLYCTIAAYKAICTRIHPFMQITSLALKLLIQYPYKSVSI